MGMDKTYDAIKASSELGRVLDWDTFSPQIPFIDFGDDLSVKVTPPRVGAMVRFLVKKKGKSKKDVSVYLDCHEILGLFGEPYWEAYPIGNDTARFAMKDTKGLLKVIRKELSK